MLDFSIQFAIMRAFRGSKVRPKRNKRDKQTTLHTMKEKIYNFAEAAFFTFFISLAFSMPMGVIVYAFINLHH